MENLNQTEQDFSQTLAELNKILEDYVLTFHADRVIEFKLSANESDHVFYWRIVVYDHTDNIAVIEKDLNLESALKRTKSALEVWSQKIGPSSRYRDSLRPWFCF